MKKYYLYILAEKKKGSLHIDITDDILKCITEINMMQLEFFKKKEKYRLVFYEETGNIVSAIRYKKKLLKWDKFWIDTLIDKCNPQWEDLI